MPKTIIESWNIRNPRFPHAVRAPAVFDIAALLVERGLAVHPFVGEQETQIQWLGGEDWTCAASFEWRPSGLGTAAASAVPSTVQSAGPAAPSAVLSAAAEGRADSTAASVATSAVPPAPSVRSQVWLRFETIDTAAEIRLNGTVIGRSDSAFRPWEFRVDGVIREGMNDLEVLIASPEKTARERAERAAYPHPHSVFPIQSMHRNMIRKPQCHSGWDWGPCVMTGGIYGPVEIIEAEGGRIAGTQVRVVPPARAGEPWTVRLVVRTEAWDAPCRIECRVDLADPDGNPVHRQVHPLDAPVGIRDHEIDIAVEEPLLWWPNGLGPQPLYTLSAAGEKPRSIGFRDLRLVTEKDEFGKSFSFTVNGHPFFAKGANWIPADAFPQHQSAERIESLVRGARDAHMNMIRVWGGGQYEGRAFYDLCDRFGILVWQDFMFACSTYPADPEFLAQVEAETEHQVRRLSHHASLALWCGNNENLGALRWFPETLANPARYLVDYDRLYEGTIGRVVRALDPERSYWPSSPSAGSHEYSDGWHEDAGGDMHYWSVWHEGKPFDDYFSVVPRFCSEFGFQSFPTPEGISRAVPSAAAGHEQCDAFPAGQDHPQNGPPRRWASPEDWNLTSATLDFHQKSPRGNTIIIETLARYFRFPDNLEDFLYLSQVQQLRAFETAVDFWRSRAPRSMGALYWQLNDLWPVASWSSIEYPDKWKVTHYGAMRFFEPLRIALIHRLPVNEPGAVARHRSPVTAAVLNDTGRSVWLRILVRAISFAGEERILLNEARTFGPEPACEIGTYDPDELGIDGTRWFIHAQLSAEGSSGETRQTGREPGRRSTEPVPTGSVPDAAGAASGYATGSLVPVYPSEPRILGVPLGGSEIAPGTVLSKSFRFFTAPKRARLEDPRLSVDFEEAGGNDSCSSFFYDREPNAAAAPIRAVVRAEKPAFYVFIDSPGMLGRWSSNAEAVLPGETWAPRFIERPGGPGRWTSALVNPRDEHLAGEQAADGTFRTLRVYSRAYDLWGSGRGTR